MKFTLNGVYICEFSDGFRVCRLDNYNINKLLTDAPIDEWQKLFSCQNVYKKKREAIEAAMKLLKLGETISWLPKQTFSPIKRIAS